jgi:hypothetical protein
VDTISGDHGTRIKVRQMDSIRRIIMQGLPRVLHALITAGDAG